MKEEEFKTYHQQVARVTSDGKTVGYYGKVFPKTAQEILEEC